MKSYSIGREANSNIVIVDPSNTVSRHHATLTIDGLKMTITDFSTNGTYINGVLITKEVPVPVKRSDVVSFANVVVLDWNKVPNSWNQLLLTILGVVAALAVFAGAGYFYYVGKEKQKYQNTLVAQQDSLKVMDMNKALADMEMEIGKLKKAYSAVSDSLKTIDAKINAKVSCAELKTATETVGQVKAVVKTVDITALEHTLIRVKDNVQDGFADADNRLNDLKDSIDSSRNSLAKASSMLNEADTMLSKIANKKVEKQNGGKDNAQKPKEPQDTTIMSPIIF